MLTIRPSSRARLPLGLAGIGLCVLGATAGSGGFDLGSPPAMARPESAPAATALVGFTANRLATEVAAKYGLHFMPATAPSDPGSVDMSTAQDSNGDQLRVIVFGRTPAPVHGVSCEITPANAVASPAVAGFLGACARIAVGGDQAAAVANWVTVAQAALAALPADETDRGRLTRSASFASVRYAVRRVPDTGEWIMSMVGEPT